MRKMIFWILGILAFIVLLAKFTDLVDLVSTIRSGAFIPILLAIIFQICRYFMQALSTQAAFNTIDEKSAPLPRLVTLIISGIFINTLAPTGGTAGAVLIADDGIKRGIEPTKAATGSILELLCHFVGFIIIMFLGFIMLQFTGRLDNVSFTLGMILVLLVSFSGGLLFYCRKNPVALRVVFKKVEELIERLCRKIHKKPPKPWAERSVTQLSDASKSISKHPSTLITTIGFSTLGYGFEMLNFVFVGLAFGIEGINVLVASYVVTTVFSIVSPAPNGVGFAEAAAMLALTGYGCSVATATAVALVYRGFVFWIPFAVGAVLLRHSGFFDSQKTPSEEDKAKTTGYLASLFLLVLGGINVVFRLLPQITQDYELLTEWLYVGGPFSPTVAVVLGIILILMVPGMWKRSRVTWAWALVFIVFLAAAQVVTASMGTFYVVIPLLALGIWLFFERSAFDQRYVQPNGKHHRFGAVIVAIAITFFYTLIGYTTLGASCFGFEHGFFDALLATAKTFVPGLNNPVAIAPYGQWFEGSVIWVFVVTLVWAGLAILIPYLQRRRGLKRGIKGDRSPFISDRDVERAAEGYHDAYSSDFIRPENMTFRPKITAPRGFVKGTVKRHPEYKGTFRKK